MEKAKKREIDGQEDNPLAISAGPPPKMAKKENSDSDNSANDEEEEVDVVSNPSELEISGHELAERKSSCELDTRHLSRNAPSPSSPSEASDRKTNSVENHKICENSGVPNPYFPLSSSGKPDRSGAMSLMPDLHAQLVPSVAAAAAAAHAASSAAASPTLEQLAQLSQHAQFARLASHSLTFSPLVSLNPLLRPLMAPMTSPLLSLYGFGAQSLAESTALYLKSRDAISQLSEHKSN